MSELPSGLKFGTDGWRAVIGEDYTFSNLRWVVQGIATYVRRNWNYKEGIVVGYDRRFGSERFAMAACEVLAGNGVTAHLVREPTTTPAIAYAVPKLAASGAIIITASHNPPSDNGLKIRDFTGAAVKPEDLVEIENTIAEQKSNVQRKAFALGREEGLVRMVDARTEYIAALRDFVDIENIAKQGYKVVVDAMYGVGAGYFSDVFYGTGQQLVEIRQEHNPAFPGLARPEPIPPYTDVLGEAVLSHDAAVGIVNDGDADRLGIVDETGVFVDQLRVMSLLAYYMLEHRGKGPIVRTVTTSSMLDRLGELYKVPVHETGVGMKYVAPKLVETGAVIGGEESGGYVIAEHMPERDGVMSGLLILDLMAREGKLPNELVTGLFNKLGKESYYHRIDMEFLEQDRSRILHQVENFRPSSLAGVPVKDIVTFDGHKIRLNDGSWVLIRFSGTESLLRIYGEATSNEMLMNLLSEGQKTTEVKTK